MVRRFAAFALSISSLVVAACGSEPETLGFGGGGSSSSTETTGSTAGSGAGVGGGASTSTETGGGASTTSATESMTTTTSTTMTNNGFPEMWPDGLSCGGQPDVTVWEYDEDTFILRQSLCTNFEGPFLYLLFGDDKVFLQDTGTGDADVAGAVAGVISDWLAKKGKASIELVVTHSHGHGDHVGGDSQFAGLPNTTVVGTSVGAVANFFGVSDWPNDTVTFELGGRPLQIVPIPGHQSAHVAVYDESRGLLLTGDTLYPGRLYINNWQDYVASIQRMADFVMSPEHPITWVLGTHIEMTKTPGQDYAFGADQHPNEHPLQLTKETLLELHQAVMDMGASPSKEVHDDFIVFPL